MINIPGLRLFISCTRNHKVFTQAIDSPLSSPWPSQSKTHQCKSSRGCFSADLAARIFSSRIVCLSCFRPLAFALSPLTALNNSCLSTALPSLDLLIERKAATMAQPPEGLLVSLRWGSRLQRGALCFRLPRWLLPSAVLCWQSGHLASNLAFLIRENCSTARRWVWKPYPAPEKGGQRSEVS